MKKYTKQSAEKTNRGPRIATCNRCKCKITEKDIVSEDKTKVVVECIKCHKRKIINKNKLRRA